MATEKAPLLDRVPDAPTESHDEERPDTFRQRLFSPWTRRMAGDYFRQVVPGAVLVIIIWSVIRAAFIENHHWSPGKGLRSQETLVPFEAHIMSKCPDAKDCLEKLVVPAMVQVSDKVNFTLSYIGRYEQSATCDSQLIDPLIVSTLTPTKSTVCMALENALETSSNCAPQKNILILRSSSVLRTV